MFNFKKKVEVVVDEKQIDSFLNRGVEAVFPNKDFLKSKLVKGERLSFYLGVDPTGKTLHLGHAIPLKKLGELQKLGHQIIFLIGDFTAMIGDPTDKSAARKKLTREQVLDNCKEYQKQASKFISFTGPNKAQMKFNSQWLNAMNFGDVLELASQMTVDQMLKRDMFQKRMAEDKPIFIHEFMYPLMQGYDSVAMDVDGEIGGNDQTFNMLTGRDLMKSIKNKEKFVLATRLLTDSSGKKMGKTEGNMVSLDQTAEDIFGKVMSWADNLIIPGFEIITDVPLEEVADIKVKIESGANPKEFKMKLASEIVGLIHGKESVEKARESFDKAFSKGEVPDDMQIIKAKKGTSLKEILVSSATVASGGALERLIEGNAIKYAGTDEVIKDKFIKIEDLKSNKLKIGKKDFRQIEVE
jgi:tyrosyl-tRNA synthetase